MSRKNRNTTLAEEVEEDSNLMMQEILLQVQSLTSRVDDLQMENRNLKEELRRGGSGMSHTTSSPAESVSAAASVPQVFSTNVAEVIAASNVKVPKLKKLTAQSIRYFCQEYEEYQHECPGGSAKRMVKLLNKMHLTHIAEYCGKTETELSALENEQFEKQLKKIIAPVDANEAHLRFREVSMASDDLLRTTLLQYNMDFDWERSCMDAIVISEKALVKKYVNGLKPEVLKTEVLRECPDDLEEAKMYAGQLIDTLRMAKSRASLFSSSSSANSNTVSAVRMKERKMLGDREKKWNSSQHEEKKEGNEKFEKKKKDYSTMKCHRCNQVGHIQWQCPNNSSTDERKKDHREIKRMTYDAHSLVKVNLNDFSSLNRDGLVRLPVVVGGVIGRLFLDSGASLSAVKETFIDKVVEQNQSVEITRGPSIPVKCAAGLRTELDGRYVQLSMEIIVEGQSKLVNEKLFIIADQEEDISFGLESMRKFDLIECLNGRLMNPLQVPICEEDVFLEHVEDEIISSIVLQTNVVEYDVCEEFPEKGRLLKLLEDYGEVFGGIDEQGMLVPPMAVNIREGASRKAQSCRFVAPHLMEKLKQTIDGMLTDGVIEPTNTAEFAAPLVLVSKPDGSIRVAVDYRDLNSSLQSFAGSIPDMKSMFAYVSGQKFYAKVDNIQGYYQLNLVEADRDKTAIITPFGLFRFKRCPFGLSTAPGVYQNRMTEVVLKGLVPEACVVFIDDTIIKGRSCLELLDNLEKVFQRMRQFNVKLKS
jgi:hypothetical protein